jgi:hypothetical protein
MFDIEYIKGERNVSDSLSRLTLNEIFIDGHVFAIEKGGRSDGFKFVRNKRLLVPKECDIPKILEEYHIKSGHGNEKVMKHNICKKYWWLGQNKCINKYVEGCLICARASDKIKNKRVISIKSNGPMDLWELDIIGPLPETEMGNKFILSLIDHYTRYAYTFPLKRKSSNSALACYLECLSVKGVNPNKVLTDNGLEFANAEFRNLCQQRGIEVRNGSPYHPQTTGAVERFNKTLLSKLRKMCNFGDQD